jgi:hypothetical protein
MHYFAIERPSYKDLRDSYFQWILRFLNTILTKRTAKQE